MNYYQRHLGDYAKDTGHLSMQEHGAYTLLLDRYYSTERPIPQGEAYRVARARTKDEQATTDGVLREFFKLVDGEWHHSYADRVIAKAQEKSKKAADSAGKRWHSDRNANAPAKAPQVAMPTHSGGNAIQESNTPIANSHKPGRGKSRASRATPLPEGFGISDRVRKWAGEKRFDRLDEYLEHLVSYAKRKAATYADWDEALMTCIREDWPKLRVAKAFVDQRSDLMREYG